MAGVACITLSGAVKLVEKSDIILRPAAYGIITAKDRILLLQMKATGKYHLPGGGIETGESIEKTLQRELREEAGIEIAVERLAHFAELFFYYDPSAKAYHGLHFYYICRPKTLALLDDEQVCDTSAETPRWVGISGLQAQDFQVHGEKIMELAQESSSSG